MCENLVQAQIGTIKIFNSDLTKNLETRFTESIKQKYRKPNIYFNETNLGTIPFEKLRASLDDLSKMGKLQT